MGGDFTYQDAGMWYTNLDKLIEYTNLKAAKDKLNIKLFYSTPNCYLKAVKDANPTLPIKQDDFFPYASDPNSYWTGYFTSRPTTKHFEREGNDYLQMAKQLQVLAGLERHNQFMLNSLKSAMGVMQHHDAITGTEKQHVTHDYERLLDNAIEDSLIIPRQAFAKMMAKDTLTPNFTYDRCRLNESSCYTSENSDKFVVTIYNPVAWLVFEPIRVPVVEGIYEVYAPNGDKIDSQLVSIPQQVIDIPTRQSEATHELVFIAHLKPIEYKSFYIRKMPRAKRDVTVVLPDKRTRELYESINEYNKEQGNPDIDIKIIEDEESQHVYKDSDVKIPVEPMIFEYPNVDPINIEVLKDKDGQIVEDMPKNIESLERIIKRARDKMVDETRKKETVNFPSLSMEEMRMLSDEPMVVEKLEDFFVIENENIKLHIDNTSGAIRRIIYPQNTCNINITYYYYPGCVGNNEVAENRSSGAYIFRPNATQPIPLEPVFQDIIRGKVVSEVRVAFGNILSTARIYTETAYVELEWLVGPIDISDNVGKEIVVKYNTDVVANGEFYTDSNGRQSLKRKLNERPQYNVTIAEPVGGNYYPITNNIYIEDDKNTVTVLTDRSQGGSSLVEGEIEIMLHRRLLHDDAFGVGEALNETANEKGLAVRGIHKLLVSNGDHTTDKKNIIQMHLRPLVFVSDAGDLSLDDWLKLRNCFSWLKQDLPVGIHLLTLEPWGDKLLLRLENYLSKSDKSTLEVDLTNILTNVNIKLVKETMLSAYEDKRNQWQWNTEKEFSESFNKEYGSFDEVKKAVDQADRYDDGYKVKLAAKEIRTFIIDYEIVK